VTDKFAADGYIALAPRFFDHIKPGIELGYTPDTIAEGRGYVMTPGLHRQGGAGRRRRDPGAEEARRPQGRGHRLLLGRHDRLAGGDAAQARRRVGLLRRRHPRHQEREATVPTQMHFGDKDMHIPMAHVNELRQLHPEVAIFDYPADHGFHCDERGSWDATASKQAMARTLELFAKHVGYDGASTRTCHPSAARDLSSV
jgi:carboxymethylenebutenolidase